MPTASTKPNTASGLTTIRVTGRDRLTFLQGQLTQDLERLTPDSARLGGWCNAKGRLHSIMWLAQWQEAYWLVLPTELAADVARRLQMFVLRADVQIAIMENSVRLLQPVDAHTPVDLPAPGGAGAYPCKSDQEGLQIDISREQSWGLRLTATKDFGAWTTAALDHYRRLMIQAGIPTVWAGSTEAFVPQMVNLDLLDGISFAKGCYVGQEIVARTQNLGRIKRRMFRYVVENPPADAAQPGAAIYRSSGSAGQIVDAVAGPEGAELLAVIRLDSRDTPLFLDEAGTLPLQPAPLPYEVIETS